jgi:NADH:ubiquinone reductase (H+-translocating)
MGVPEWSLRAKAGVFKKTLERHKTVAQTYSYADAQARLVGPAQHPGITSDRSWIHVWKPMLHTFAAGTWNIYEQQVQYVTHARAHHFEYVHGQLDAIDRAAGRIRLAPLQAAGEVVAGARELDYDVLVLAFGSRANDFGTPGVVEHCHFIDSQDQADAFNARMRAQVVRSFAQGGDINIAIVGGGATGVELASELSRRSRGYRRLVRR